MTKMAVVLNVISAAGPIGAQPEEHSRGVIDAVAERVKQKEPAGPQSGQLAPGNGLVELRVEQLLAVQAEQQRRGQLQATESVERLQQTPEQGRGEGGRQLGLVLAQDEAALRIAAV